MLVKRHCNYLPNLVSDFWGEDLFPDFQYGFKQTPAINIIDRDQEFRVEIAAPGLCKEDFNVHVEKNTLEISADKKEEKDTQDGKYLRREFSYSEFRHSFSLPPHVEAEQVKAEYNNGVLTVEIPKRDEAKVNPRKQIAVS